MTSVDSDSGASGGEFRSGAACLGLGSTAGGTANADDNLTASDWTEVSYPGDIRDPECTDLRGPGDITDSDWTFLSDTGDIADPDCANLSDTRDIADPDCANPSDTVDITDPDSKDDCTDLTDHDVTYMYLSDIGDVTDADCTSDLDEPSTPASAGTPRLQTAMNRMNWLKLVELLTDPMCSIATSDIKECLSAAVSTNWYLAIAQLLPLLPETEAEFHLHLLRSAIESRKWLAAGVLINEGARFKQLGETDLALACQPGATVEFVRQFAGRDSVDGADLHGRTALSYAAQCGLPRLVRLLCRELGARPDLADSGGLTPMDYAVAALDCIEDQRREDISDVIELLS